LDNQTKLVTCFCRARKGHTTSACHLLEIKYDVPSKKENNVIHV